MSERGFSTTIENALEAGRFDGAFFVELDLGAGIERFWSGVGDKTYDSDIYTGVGTLGSIDKVGDSLEKADIGVELILDYLDDTLRNTIVTGDDPLGNDAAVHLVVMDPDTGDVVDGHELFSGFVDEVELLDAGDSGQIRIRLASELARLSKPHVLRYTDAHQQYLFPGDVGLEFSTRMSEPIMWGRKPVTVAGGGGGSRQNANEDYPNRRPYR